MSEMKTKIILMLTASVYFAVSVLAQNEKARQGSSSFAGTWEGKMNDIPGVKLTIEESGGKFTGSMIFYFQERKDENSPWHVAAEHPVPLLSPHVENKTLTFEVQHHKCHDCAELGPNVKFRMELAGTNEARLWNLAESASKDPGPGMKLVRSSEAATPKDTGSAH